MDGANALDSSASALAAATTTLTIGTAASYYWNAIPSRPSSYCAPVGVKLSFTYAPSHNVWLLASKAKYDACDFSGGTELGSASLGGGPNGNNFKNLYEAVTQQTGVLYIACQKSSHCLSGQKIAVTVSDACPSPPPPPPAAKSPFPPGNPSPPPSTSADETPCFPSDATVTRADGATVRLDRLSAGDRIHVVDGFGARTTDVVSHLSYADPHAKPAQLVALSTRGGGGSPLRLTADHRVAVGAQCCADVKRAADVVVGDTLWVVRNGDSSNAAAAAAAATAQHVTKVAHGVAGAGLHNPLMSRGTYPIVNGVVTAFDRPTVMRLAALVVPAADAVCGLSAVACLVIQHIVADLDGMHTAHGKRYVDGATATDGLLLTLLLTLCALAVATSAASWAWWWSYYKLCGIKPKPRSERGVWMRRR